MVLEKYGGGEGFSDEALACTRQEAKDARYLEGGVGEANIIDFGERIFACMTDADLELIESRSG